MQDKKVFNILRILEDLKKGKTICIKEYANILNVSNRSVIRYIKEIASFYDIDFIKPKRGCYALFDISKIKEKIVDVKESEDFEKFADILGVLNKNVLNFLGIDEKIIKKIVSEDIFLIKENPVESFLNIKFYKKIKSAIKYKKVLEIRYFSDKEYIFKNVKPLKIVFGEGNWYLACLSDDEINNGFKFLRINFITDVKETTKSFKVDLEAKEFLKNFQTFFSQYKKSSFEVVLEIDEKIKRYFKVKTFFPSQKIIKEDKNLIVKYLVSCEEEILPFIKKWLPYIKIKSPISLKNKLIEDLENYLKSVK